MGICTAVVKQLRAIVGRKHVLDSQEDLLCYSFDGTFAEFMPDLVVEPGCTEEVSAILKLANEHEIPIIARGMGSGLAAGTHRASPQPDECDPGDRSAEHDRHRGGRGHHS